MFALIVHPDDEPVVHNVSGRVIVGRGDTADIRIDNVSLSREHARFVFEDGRLWVEDLGSRNGTWMDGRAVESTELVDGALVSLGTVIVAVRMGPSASVPPPNTALLQTMVADVGERSTGGVRLKTTAENRQVDELAVLLEVTRLLSRAADVDEVLSKVIGLAERLFDVDYGAVLVQDGVWAARAECRSRRGRGDTWSSHVVAWAADTGTAALFSDASADPRLSGAESILAASIRCAMAAPLMADGELLGVLYVDNRTVPYRFDERDLEFLAAFASQAAAALDAARLRDRVRTETEARAAMARFFPPQVLDRIGSRLDAGETVVTAMFCDIVAFTPMSARLEATELMALLNRYIEQVVHIVVEEGGTLEKYIGDAVLAVWGAPLKETDDADRAVAAASRIPAAVAKVRTPWQEPLRVRVGLNTGRVAAGLLGTQTYVQYATIGNTTNVAARVASVAQPGEVVITDTTRQHLLRDWPLADRGRDVLKGVAEPVGLWRVETST